MGKNKKDADKLKKSTRGFVDEFKTFALRGNVVDLAVGVVIGGAFNKISTSLAADVLMPFLGWMIGGMDFTKLQLTLPSLYGKEPVVMAVGTFVQTVVDFVLIALAVFVAIKVVNVLRRTQDEKKEAEEKAEKGES